MAFNAKYIGGLWNSTSGKGTKFMNGSITLKGETTKIVIFKNSQKKQAKHPDYTIMLDASKKTREDWVNYESE